MSRSSCVFNPPPGSKGFRQLVSLELYGVTFEPASFENFISQCPSLEELSLLCEFEFDSLKINVPSLKLLDFQGNCVAICCRNSPNLAKLVLSSTREIVENHLATRVSTFNRVICSLLEVPTLFALSHVRVICLWFCTKEALCYSFTSEVPFFIHKLYRGYGGFMYTLLDQTLSQPANIPYTVELLRAQNSSDCTLNSLRKFVFVNGSGVEPEEEFIKYLLACAPTLNEIELNWPDIRGGGGYGATVEKLKQFPRASPKITMKYHEISEWGQFVITSFIE